MTTPDPLAGLVVTSALLSIVVCALAVLLTGFAP